ncbi:hypothetical protein BURPS1106A_3155 [Burkholderia pseudomallei 1106a]|uniref:Uncharacterized protein n=1 Tax=Burkholderia pseudomallei (strain 1106a) TaxID=357348 RepID=A3NYH3_BURP0|nr:hypothetical protein BURPS1106A_3155 [Burkholderia pseudomallei 1106a]
MVGLGRKDDVCDDRPLGIGPLRVSNRLRPRCKNGARSFAQCSPGPRAIYVIHCFC